MTYTKDNILNLRFRRRKGKGTAEYVIRAVFPSWIEFKHVQSGYSGSDYLDIVLRRLNEGKWVVVGEGEVNKVEKQLEVYQIY